MCDRACGAGLHCLPDPSHVGEERDAGIDDADIVRVCHYSTCSRSDPTRFTCLQSELERGARCRSTAFVAAAVAALAADPDVARGTESRLSSGQLARVYGFTDLDGSQPDAWRYLVEVQDPGKPADVTGYR